MAKSNDGDNWKFKPKSIQEQVTDRLREAILSGELTMGIRLNENELAHTLGVSRVPIRGALQQLSSEGLVDNSPGMGRLGRRVHVPSPAQIREIQEVRGVIEGLAARKLAERARTETNPEWLTELYAINQEMAQYHVTGEIATYFVTSRRFHIRLVENSGSETLVRFHAYLMNRAGLFRLITGGMPARQTRALREHEMILEAIQQGNPDAAEESTRIHHENGMFAMIEALEKRSETFEDLQNGETTQALVH